MANTDFIPKLGRPQFTCQRCNRVFYRAPSVEKHDPPKYCSNTCRYADFREHGWPKAKPKIEKACEMCGKAMLLHPSNTARRFCSQRCMLVWRGPVISKLRLQSEKRITRTCKHCGQAFETFKCRLDGVRGVFCSKACLGAWTVRNNASSISKREIEFQEAMRSAGLVFESQAVIGKWVVDFCFEIKRLVVEFDGEYWHSLPSSVLRDARKDTELKELGYSVLRVPERLWLEDSKQALKLVFDALQ